MNEKQSIPAEKSMKIAPFYAGGFIMTDKPWPNEARHNINPIVDGGSVI